MVDINDTEVIGGLDAMVSIAIPDAETAAGADTETNVGLVGTETGGGLEAETDRNTEDRDWAIAHEYFEITVFKGSHDLVHVFDTTEFLGEPITSSDTIHGADASAGIEETPAAVYRRWSVVQR